MGGALWYGFLACVPYYLIFSGQFMTPSRAPLSPEPLASAQDKRKALHYYSGCVDLFTQPTPSLGVSGFHAGI